MAEEQTTPKVSFVEKMTMIPRQWLYATLIVLASIPLFFPTEIPITATPSTASLYRVLMKLPEGSSIILQSDFTKSTRGESMGQLEAVLRILMERKIKFALISVADPQAPQVARDVIKRINAERGALEKTEYKKWEDWVDLGYFPSGEALAKAMANNVRTAWNGRTDLDPNNVRRPVFESPVLSHIKGVGDFPLLLNLTGSKTIDIINERLGDKVTVAATVTGVMGPESLNYYKSNQVKGLAIGLAGVVELEAMMVKGIDPNGANGAMTVPGDPAPPLPGAGYARGMSYYGSLHTAMILMVLAVIVGNVGMFLTKRGARK
ncbi:MAG: hypothetical protein KF784_08615 [Fimbriimonadaceae bacterium]|nr:hypothetical protein [Fimbriimonadaceae bacterium]